MYEYYNDVSHCYVFKNLLGFGATSDHIWQDGEAGKDMSCYMPVLNDQTEIS